MKTPVDAADWFCDYSAFHLTREAFAVAVRDGKPSDETMAQWCDALAKLPAFTTFDVRGGEVRSNLVPALSLDDSVALLVAGRDGRLEQLSRACRLLGFGEEARASWARLEEGVFVSVEPGRVVRFEQLWWARVAILLSGKDAPSWCIAEFDA